MPTVQSKVDLYKNQPYSVSFNNFNALYTNNSNAPNGRPPIERK